MEKMEHGEREPFQAMSGECEVYVEGQPSRAKAR